VGTNEKAGAERAGTGENLGQARTFEINKLFIPLVLLARNRPLGITGE